MNSYPPRASHCHCTSPTPNRHLPLVIFSPGMAYNQAMQRARTIRGPRLAAWALSLLLAAGCGPRGQPPTPTTAGTTVPPTATASRSPEPSATASASPTPDPYAGLTIEDLAAREYGGGELSVDRWTQPAFGLERGYFHYPSDDLTIHGFMNVPQGDGPFPVVLLLHGYVNPASYTTLTYTTPYADALAREGFLVLHPNYRNHPPSDQGPDEFRVGYAIDVLNLVAIVRQTAGRAGALEKADPTAVGLFGHSMGGGIALRSITVDPSIKAAVVYGSMSGDERRNYARIVEWTDGLRGWQELMTPEEDMKRISPIDNFGRITAAVSIHHGELDEEVPPEWSEDLCDRLIELEKKVECYSYEGMPHVFYGEADRQLLARTVAFLRANLSPK